jgi:hypothetical protein
MRKFTVVFSISLMLAAPSAAWAVAYGGTDNADTYRIGCVTRASKTARIWLCRNNDPGADWIEVNADCVMDEDIVIVLEGGNDVGHVGRSTSTVYACGGESHTFGPITHSGYTIEVYGTSGNDTLYGDNSALTYLVGDGNDDEIRHYGQGELWGGSGADSLFSHSTSGDDDELWGQTGGDCLQDDNGWVTVFDCGTNPSNYYVDNIDPWSSGQPDAACDWEVETCEEGPESPEGEGEGEAEPD